MTILPDKEQKKQFKIIASQNPDTYFPTGELKKNGFSRHTCTKCGTNHWSTLPREICGDPDCTGGFSFIGNSPVTRAYTYPELIVAFAAFFKERGYTPIPRYPVVARWRDDTDFVGASIYNFQPHVVSGAVKPPANPLTVPQPSLRFNDIDNVGITSSHYSCFVMIGQCAFTPPDEFKQDTYFIDLLEWFTIGLGIPRDEIQIHEDAWAGGGNFGPCMEFFSRGLELANQVYMLYEQTSQGPKELSLKVLDMGLGAERNAWFSQGKNTSYETTFPPVVTWLREKTGVTIDQHVVDTFMPYGPMLNADEVEDMDDAWERVSALCAIPSQTLKDVIKPLAAIYSIAEHSRALLFAIADGALPSNVRGGHNLRVLLRRALSFKTYYGWDFDFLELFRLHAQYLAPIYPELVESVPHVQTIIKVEMDRFDAQQEKADRIIDKSLTDMTHETMKLLYESYGITPEHIVRRAKEQGVPIEVKGSFYAELSQSHQEREAPQTVPTLSGYATRARYFEDWRTVSFTARVIAKDGDQIVLDETYFYPTSGGQVHDEGTMNGKRVVTVSKNGATIIHHVPGNTFIVGDKVMCEIDWKRRLQLAQHHSATHVIGAAARAVLGPHVWQAGSEKRTDKARLDITHYESLTRDEERAIEMKANAIIAKGYGIETFFVTRDEAEKLYGFSIYQGGAVPGNELRLVKIEDLDIEACGGTHVDSTDDIGVLKLLRSTRISDGVVRLEYVTGVAAEAIMREEMDLIARLCTLLECVPEQIPARCEELFSKWKKVKKLRKKNEEIPDELVSFSSSEPFDGDVLDAACGIMSTQRDHLVKSVERFLTELRSP